MESRPLPPDPRRRRAPVFRPRFSLAILYLVGFFFLYALLLVVPELTDVLAQTPPGPEQEELARSASHKAIRPLLPLAAGMALLSTLAGAHFQVLPGLRD
jgi:hypothetical protein